MMWEMSPLCLRMFAEGYVSPLGELPYLSSLQKVGKS